MEALTRGDLETRLDRKGTSFETRVHLWSENDGTDGVPDWSQPRSVTVSNSVEKPETRDLGVETETADVARGQGRPKFREKVFEVNRAPR